MMTELIDVMTATQLKRYLAGSIELTVTKDGTILATDGLLNGQGRSPRLAIEAMA